MIYFYKRLNKKINKTLLEKNPQKKAIVLKVKTMSPKKPNSGKRPVVKVKLTNKYLLIAHIPGIGHSLHQYSNVLIMGNGVRDLPAINYSAIRGKYDLIKVLNRYSRKSIYGIRSDIKNKNLRRKFRKN